MAQHQHHGADAAPGPVAPAESDDARVAAGIRGLGERTENPDCAVKLLCTVQARAALLGIEVRQIDGGAWLLRYARGADIGVVQGLDALAAAVTGFESAQRGAAELVARVTEGARHG